MVGAAERVKMNMKIGMAIVTALMATPAWAQGLVQCIGCGEGGLSLPPIEATLPTKTKCEAGWTLVYVDTAHGGFNTAKCAAVGDLRDPE
jgi:hypothetical protein